MACEPFISVGLGVMLPKPFTAIVAYSMASYFFFCVSATLLLLDLWAGCAIMSVVSESHK